MIEPPEAIHSQLTAPGPAQSSAGEQLSSGSEHGSIWAPTASAHRRERGGHELRALRSAASNGHGLDQCSATALAMRRAARAELPSP